MLSQGFNLLVPCAAETQPLHGAGKLLSCCYETHLRMGLFHSPIMTALTCCGGIPALCQAGESRDAELPSPPNIKGNEAVPMELILLSGHRSISPELPFEEAGSEV